jgi:trimeric autotransporter adhesin
VVRSSVTFALPSNVEDLQLIGSGSINGYGNQLGNRIVGNSAANLLDGGAGVDQLVGGAGDDYYIVDSSLDVVVENVGEGIDTIESRLPGTSGATVTLPANVENLRLGPGATRGFGNSLENVLTGNELDNYLLGNRGSDVLYGFEGDDILVGDLTLSTQTEDAWNDVMYGGPGNDVYYVNTAGDEVHEMPNEGTDIVRAEVHYTLPPNVENLELFGFGNFSGTGNALNNTITGNSQSNVLNGGDGDDIIEGRDGADVLIGGPGRDRLIGGQGDDTYIVVDLEDEIVEDAFIGSGVDTVESSLSLALPANVERLVLTGTADLSGQGNELSNVLIGNAGNNTLIGGGGDDELMGVPERIPLSGGPGTTSTT